MLLTEIHGKRHSAIAENEDYLTSAIFGHLRYVRPGPFWTDLMSRARTAPIDGVEETFSNVLGKDFDLLNYVALDSFFWPNCVGLGRPELALVFRGGGQEPLVVLVEVKLGAPKSGRGERDQLMRYLRIADRIEMLTPSMPPAAQAVVLYLTPRETRAEVEESLAAYGDSAVARRRLFRLQWQDMVDSIRATLANEEDFAQRILVDVATFLERRGYEYFRGFNVPVGLEALEPGCGHFYLDRD